jgi:hypothetical protein
MSEEEEIAALVLVVVRGGTVVNAGPCVKVDISSTQNSISVCCSKIL